MSYEYNGESYHDDRMFILYICKVRAEESDEDRRITIYHEEAHPNHVWGVVFYRNSKRYMPTKVDYFRTKEDAEEFFEEVAPQTPLVSLQGESPRVPMTFENYTRWVKDNGWSEYDYRQRYMGDASNPCETIYEPL